MLLIISICFRWLIFIDWARRGLTKTTALVRTAPWFVINIIFGAISSEKAGKHFKKHLCTIFFVSLASTPKEALENNFFRLFQHLVGVCHNAIGCGIYQEQERINYYYYYYYYYYYLLHACSFWFVKVLMISCYVLTLDALTVCRMLNSPGKLSSDPNRSYTKNIRQALIQSILVFLI